MTQRECGGCTLCCKLLPMQRDKGPKVAEAMDAMIRAGLADARTFARMLPDFDKPSGQRCQHQRHKGCAVYAQRPFGCRYWNCRWLVNDDTADQGRPDRTHYVIDIMPDFVSVRDDATGATTNLEVVQIWCDPKYPDAHRDPKLRAYLERRAKNNVIGLVRYSSRDAIALIPPIMSVDHQWHEHRSGMTTKEHELEDIMKALA